MIERSDVNERRLSFVEGHRVQLHPATDAWMMGDRYGTVVKVAKHIHVLMDRSNKVRKMHPFNVEHVS